MLTGRQSNSSSGVESGLPYQLTVKPAMTWPGFLQAGVSYVLAAAPDGAPMGLPVGPLYQTPVLFRKPSRTGSAKPFSDRAL